jgi:hypothetical protein
MQQVGRGLQAHSAESRAAAVEALDTLGDKQLVKQIIPLVEDSDASERLSIETAWQRCLASHDLWLRAVAARATHNTAPFEVKELNTMETLPTMSVLERVLLLHEVPLFAALSPDDLAQIATIAQEQWHADGASICREGEQGREMYVLAQGQVRVTKQTSEGEKHLAMRYAGDFIGEMSIILAAPRTSSVYADGEVRSLVISDEAFTAILHDRPDVALSMMRGVMQRFRELEERLAQAP